MKCKLSVDKVALTLAILFAALHTAGVLGIRVGLMGLLEWAHMVRSNIPSSRLAF